MLATLPISDEIMVFPSTLLKATAEDAPYAFGFVIANDTPGLKFICRESFDYGRSHFDHPLGSRFEEMDAVVVFDDVHVPWERVLLYRDVERCNAAHAAHRRRRRHGASGRRQEHRQVRVRAWARRAARRHDRRRELPAYPREARRALGDARDDAGAPARRRSRRRARRVGRHAPGVEPARRRAQPVPAALSAHDRDPAADRRQRPGRDADRAGPARPAGRDIRRYYQAARADAFERIPLFRLAWDAAISAFAGRQVLYERFFFGDPVRMAGALVAAHDAEIREYAARVRELVRDLRDEALPSANSLLDG